MSAGARVLPALLLISVVSPAGSLSTDNEQPLDITSVSLEYDEVTREVIHRGGVVATQGSRCMAGEVLTLSLDEENRVGDVRLEGVPAYFRVRSDNRNVDTIGRALVISFDSENNRYVLTGDVRLDHDGSVFEGDEVSYDTEDNSVSITGQRAVLQPGRRGNQTADVPERDPCSPA